MAPRKFYCKGFVDEDKKIKCQNTPIYGINKESGKSGNPEYCSKCRAFAENADQLVNVKNKRCEGKIDLPGGGTNHCTAQATFGVSHMVEVDGKMVQKGKKVMCGEHRYSNMINLSAKTCSVAGCVKRAGWGLISDGYGGRIATHCCECAKNYNKGLLIADQMRNVTCNYCIEIIDGVQCINRARYDADESGKPTHCREHSNDKTELLNKKCEKCKKVLANFGFLNQKATHCGSCKLEGMVDVKNMKCIHKGCYIQRTFGERGGSAQYCREHKLSGMIDVRHKLCLTPNCDVRAIEKYKDYCFKCYVEKYPDEPVPRNHKVKEESVAKFIDYYFREDYEIKYDKRLPKMYYRPDIVIYTKDRVIIIEVDERQHDSENYGNEQDEIDREIKISKAFDVPAIFVRFNPDSYSYNKESFRSPWRQISGTMKINSANRWLNRLRTLVININYRINNPLTDKKHHRVRLWYDGCTFDDGEDFSDEFIKLKDSKHI